MRWALGAVVALTVVRLVLAGQLGLVADEAYYWTWSEDLGWRYFDHPAGVAWLIAAGTAVLGDTELGVRIGGIVLQGAALAALVWHERGRPGLVLLLGVPAVVLPGVLATPDVGLLALWIGAVVAHQRGRWLAAGLLAGAAVWFKLPGVLLLGALLACRDWRSAAVGALVASPALGGHVLFQLDHGLARGDGGLGPMLELLGAQALFLGPLLLVAAFAWLARGPRDAWWWSAVLTLAVFVPASLLSRGEGNWGLPFCIAAVVGCSRLTGTWGRVAEWGGWFALFGTAFVVVHALHPLVRLPSDPLDQTHVGPVLGESVEAWGVEPVLCSRYQEASWIRFYGGVEATTVPDHGRVDQYDAARPALPASTVFVRPARTSRELATDALYPDSRGPHDVVARDGDRVRMHWQVWEGEGYSPGE